MKNTKNTLALIFGVFVFGGLIAAAIILQSAYLLYAATGIPILLVPFLPDIRTSKILKPGDAGSQVRLYRTSSNTGEGFVIIEAAPGHFPWHKRKIYFSLNGIPTVTSSLYSPNTAGIPVLPYDLTVHRRHKHLHGIELVNLSSRLRTLSYTTAEVTRLVIRVEDLTGQPAVSNSSVATPAPRARMNA